MLVGRPGGDPAIGLEQLPGPRDRVDDEAREHLERRARFGDVLAEGVVAMMGDAGVKVTLNALTGKDFDNARDSGKFDWSASGKFPSLSEPEPAYHGLAFHPALGAMAFTFHSIAVGLRDLGMTMNPQGAHYTLMGIETLSLRMERHIENARKVAEWLEKDPRIDYVTYAGLPSSPYHHRVARICPKGAGALFTFAVKGGYDACVKLIDNVKLFSHVANLGDTRSLILHPASTTHRQLTEEQQIKAGAAPNMVRVSIGIEDVEDIIADLDQALAKAHEIADLIALLNLPVILTARRSLGTINHTLLTAESMGCNSGLFI